MHGDVMNGPVEEVVDDDVEVRFRVSKLWKGKESKDVVVRTAWMGPACGYGFEIGQEYVGKTSGIFLDNVSL